MNFAVVAGAGLAGLVLLFSGTADASPRFKTSYVYYSIKGKSAPELYEAMIARGSHVNGAKAYASTSATSSQEGKLLPGKQCRVTDYKFSIDFVIRLPRLSNEKGLRTTTRKRWEAFSTFLRKHEESHRSIWLACAQELEDKVRAIREDDCDEVDRKAAELWEDIRGECNLKHDAFDTAEQKRLADHPFVKQVLRQVSQATAAAKIAAPQKKKKKRRLASD